LTSNSLFAKIPFLGEWVQSHWNAHTIAAIMSSVLNYNNFDYNSDWWWARGL